MDKNIRQRPMTGKTSLSYMTHNSPNKSYIKRPATALTRGANDVY
jgi:hypothetical protein